MYFGNKKWVSLSTLIYEHHLQKSKHLQQQKNQQGSEISHLKCVGVHMQGRIRAWNM